MTRVGSDQRRENAIVMAIGFSLVRGGNKTRKGTNVPAVCKCARSYACHIRRRNLTRSRKSDRSRRDRRIETNDDELTIQVRATLK